MYDTKLAFENFGKTLRKLRLEKGWSQRRLSELCDVDPEPICYWESGRRTPSFFSLIKLCNALEMTADELLRKCEEVGRNG